MRHVDIVGMSLAELSLSLLFVVLALLPPSSPDELSSARTQLATVSSQLAIATKHIDELSAQSKQLQGFTRMTADGAAARHLRSITLPSCAEKKVRNDWLFTTVVRGEDLYDVQDIGTLNLQQILDRFKRELDEATLAECVQRIQVRVGNDVSAIDYDLALRRLEQHFYPRKLGSENQ
jgi:hypothetical protein